LTGRKRLSGLVWEGPDQVLAQGGFLTLTRRWVRNHYEDGSRSQAYEVETAHPPFRDAVILLLFSPDDKDMARIALRRAVRPSVALRSEVPCLAALDGRVWSGALWELPAGGVEPGDLEPAGQGLLGRACQEAWEEAGLRLGPGDFAPLGPPPFSAPAFCPERLHFFAARVDPSQALPPPGDGHPMEEGAEVSFVGLAEALQWCAQGKILDGKTELGLRRFREWLGQNPRERG
jgi:ADP-ribose pyrophosphatase